MWQPKLERYTRPDGSEGKIGWILVDEAGRSYKHPSGGIVTDFAPEPMQRLADQLNAERGRPQP